MVQYAPYCAEMSTGDYILAGIIFIIGGPFFIITNILETILDNIKYYAKNLQGEQIQGIKVGNESWGDSATAELILATTEKNGLNNENYTFDYIWSTTEPIDWEDAKQVTLTPRQGAKNIKTTILIEGNTGKGKLYVKASNQFKTAIGTTYNSSLAKSVSLNLDCTPPIYKVEYKTADGTWRPLEEFLEDPNGYFTMSRYGFKRFLQ